MIQGLLEAWPDGDEICLISRTPLATTPLRSGWGTVVDSGSAALPSAVWEQLRLPRVVRDSGADALLAPNYSMPLRAPCPTAVCMHDCAPFAVPQGFRPRERWRRRVGARIAARRAAFLFMGSRFAADEAHKHLSVLQERLLVVPWGLTRGFAQRFRMNALSPYESATESTAAACCSSVRIFSDVAFRTSATGWRR